MNIPSAITQRADELALERCIAIGKALREFKHEATLIMMDAPCLDAETHYGRFRKSELGMAVYRTTQGGLRIAKVVDESDAGFLGVVIHTDGTLIRKSALPPIA